MAQSVVIIDYGSGNLRSAEKALVRAAEASHRDFVVSVTSDPEHVRKADRLVLPGVGAFADCRQGLLSIAGMKEAIYEVAREKANPFLGICVGMQLLATSGEEHGSHAGMGWIDGIVKAIEPTNESLKIPHMGWNEVTLTDTGRKHPVASALTAGDHAYFVHSYHMDVADAGYLLATTEYGNALTAIVGRDNIIGSQFHPEKSQAVGLTFLRAFLEWQI